MNRLHDVYKGDTTDEEINEAISGKLDVMTAIINEIQTDDENESMRLLEAYKDASEEERAVLDYALTCITGYTMGTIIEKAKELTPLED